MIGCLGILSCDKYSERREACENTWIKDFTEPDKIDYVFLVGRPGIGETIREGHFLYIDCADDYDSLHLKTLGFLAWAKDKYDWIFKCDDDTYVAKDRFEIWLCDTLKQSHIYVGKKHIFWKMEGHFSFLSNWKELYDIGYALGGGGYFINKIGIAKALDAWSLFDVDKAVATWKSNRTGKPDEIPTYIKVFPEDVTIGLLLGQMGIKVINDNKFHSWNVGTTNFVNGYDDGKWHFITIHKVDPLAMKHIYDNYPKLNII